MGVFTILPALLGRCHELGLSSFSPYDMLCELVPAAPPAPPPSFSSFPGPLGANLYRLHQTSSLSTGFPLWLGQWEVLGGERGLGIYSPAPSLLALPDKIQDARLVLNFR